MSTAEDNGILLYNGDSDHMAVELYQGHVRVSYDPGSYPSSAIYRWVPLTNPLPTHPGARGLGPCQGSEPVALGWSLAVLWKHRIHPPLGLSRSSSPTLLAPHRVLMLMGDGTLCPQSLYFWVSPKGKWMEQVVGGGGLWSPSGQLSPGQQLLDCSHFRGCTPAALLQNEAHSWGGGALSPYSAETINDGQFHTVELVTFDQMVNLSIDGGSPLTMDNSGKHYTLNGETPLYVGGERLASPTRVGSSG